MGRSEELGEFRKMLVVRDASWLMWVVGPAGQGKSKFLEACLEECNKQNIKHSGIIDFFNDGLRTRWGVIAELAKRFNVENDGEFSKAFTQYQNEITKGDLADPAVIQFSLNRSEEALITAICPKRSGKPRVILVDTVEEVVENLGLWFFEKFLPKLYPYFRVVACGRKVPNVGEDASMWKGEAPYYCNLKGLSIDSLRLYLQEDKLLTDEMESYLPKLYQLTEKGGQALLIALACLSLKENRLVPQDFETINETQFLRKLVIDPHREETIENLVILQLAHVYHGYNPETLKLRYTLEQLNSKSYEAFLEGLIRYPYIKYHPDTGTVRLHDYFRERLSEELWTGIDPELATRANISKQLADYFEYQIQEHKRSNTSESPALDTLRHQWLYHLLFSDRERAYSALWDLLDTSWHAFKYDYMDSLLDMTQDVNKSLDQIGKFDKILDRLEKSARTWMGLEIWETERALSLADTVIKDSGGVRRFELTAKVAKATALGRLGRFEESVSLLEKSYLGYEKLLELVQKAASGDPVAQNEIKSEHGVATIRGILPERYLILNTIGVLMRNRGHYDDALSQFEKSYSLSRLEGDKTWQASAITQIGTVLRYKGDFAQAHDRIYQGLALRKKNGQRGREAFSINALGMLQRDEGHLDKARMSFNEAYNIWKTLRAEVDMASVSRNLGWIDYLEGKFDAAEENYAQAESIFNKKGLVRELPNLRQKQGALWMGRAKIAKTEIESIGCFGKAVALLEEGIHLADEHNQPLYAALCITDLCKIAEMRGEFEKIPDLEKRLRKFEKDGYNFEPAYADLEEILGKVAERNAMKNELQVNMGLFDEATDHYCQMFVYLARFSSIRYRERREFLRKWLPSLPDELRHRACKRLVEGWQNTEDLATVHPGFIITVQTMDDL